MSRCTAALTCLLLIPAALSADVTLQYKVQYHLNAALPAALTQAMDTARLTPSEITIHVSGGRSLTAQGALTSISDLSTGKITLLDPVHQHFATVPISQFADQAASAIPKMPAAAQGVMASMKMTTDSRATGRTAEIQGIQADEHEFILSMGMQMTPDAPPTAVMKMVMQLWQAKPEEMNRNPALREFVAAGTQQMSGIDPTEMFQKLFAQFPGMGDSLDTFMKDVAATHSVTLRTHLEMFMPVLAMLSQRMPAGNNPLAGVDPDAAFMTMDQELAGLSTAPLDQSVFQIPDGYTAVPLADILAANMPTPATKPALAPQN